MELTIAARNLTLNDAIEKYAHKRLAKLDRRLRRSVPVRLVLRHERTRDVGERYIAEITANLSGTFLRGEERAATVNAAIDAVGDVVDRQIRRYKTRRRRRRSPLGELEAGIASELAAESGEEAEDKPLEDEDGRIVRVKRHAIDSMTVTEAATRMDLVGHSFYVFRNSASDSVNVVYRRSDGDYGLIVTEEGTA